MTDTALETDLLFRGNPRIGRFFRTDPYTLWGVLFFAVLLLLCLPAYLLQIHDLPVVIVNVGTVNRGFWYTLNWAPLYLLAVPPFFAKLASLTRDASRAILSLCEARRIMTRSGEPATATYPKYIAERLARSARLTTWATAGVATVVVVVDVHGWLTEYLHCFGGGACLPPGPDADWATHYMHGGMGCLNLLFDGVAYAFEWGGIFACILWTVRFYLFLRAVADSLSSEKVEFNFVPNDRDLDFKLGLRPIGRLFNGFLFQLLLFEVFVVSLRIRLISTAKGGFGVYVHQLLKSAEPIIQADGAVAKLAAVAGHFYAIVGAELNCYSSMTAGMWMVLVFVALPVIVISYLPLVVLRGYIEDLRDRAWRVLQVEQSNQRLTGTQETVQALQTRMDILDKSSIWPNGYDSARRFFIGLSVLWTAAAAPAVLVHLACVGAILDYVLSLFKGSGAASHHE